MTYNSTYTGPQIDKAARLASVVFDDLAAVLADARDYTAHTAGDVFWTAAEGFRYGVAASGASDHQLTTDGGVKLYVLPTAEGAISYAACNPTLDTETEVAHTANQTAMNAAIAAAARTGVEAVALPAATIWAKADNGTATGSGLRISLADNQKIKFFGQAGTVIKRIALSPPITLAPTSAMVWMTANAGITIEWHHVTFDGNEANCEYDSENAYDEEQSASLRWLTGTGTPKRIGIFHCDVGKNRVGDGYMQNVRVDHFIASDCTTEAVTVRRVRADWQFSRYATYDTVMTNIVCNAWESEPSGTVAGARLFLSNVMARSAFDLAGDATNAVGDRQPILASLTNVVCLSDDDNAGLPFVNFWRVHGTAVNCHFRNINRVHRCKLKFIGGSITVPAADDGDADAVQVWHDHSSAGNATYINNAGNFVEFHGVTFFKDAGVTEGTYVMAATTVEVADLIEGNPLPRISIIDCHTPEPIDTVVSVVRHGMLEIRGGYLRGNLGIFSVGNDASRIAHLVCGASPLWDAPALMHNLFSFGATTGETVLNISGQFDGETMVPLENGGTRITGGSGVIWNVSAIAIVASHPQGRIRTVPGLRAKLRNQSYGEPTMWEVINTGTMTETGHNGTDWRAIAGGGKKGATADRPTTPSTYDIGFTYFDTTLDADGLPIFWQGTKWIRSDGADA